MKNFIDQLPSDYISDVLVRMAHHSSAIEGNTISFADTATLLLDKKIPKDLEAELREVYEITNHEKCLNTILKHVDNNESLTTEIIKEIHSNLLENIRDDNGQFKTVGNIVGGSPFPTAPPHEAPLATHRLVDNLNYRLDIAEDKFKKIEAILETHMQFERIHPFSDGNGRTGRMIMFYSLLSEGIAPLIIEYDERKKYYEFLRNADLDGFKKYAIPKIENEEQRIMLFIENDKHNIIYSQEQLEKMEQHLDDKQKEILENIRNRKETK